MQSSFKKSRLRTQAGQAALISLIITIAILGILAAIFYPKMAGRSEYSVTGEDTGTASPMDRADDASCMAYRSQITDATNMYMTDHNHPPRSLQDLKKYGVTQSMIDTPNCNFVLPKGDPTVNNQAAAPPPVAPSSNTFSTSANGVTTVNTGTGNAPAAQAAPPPGGYGQPPAPADGNNILPTKMGRSIPLDGGSSRDEKYMGNN
jgi:competence protein ComGC